jgi:hypothetical protein
MEPDALPVDSRDVAANEARRYHKVRPRTAQEQLGRASRRDLEISFDEHARARDVDEVHLVPARKLDVRQPGHFAASPPERHATLLAHPFAQLLTNGRVAGTLLGAARGPRQNHRRGGLGATDCRVVRHRRLVLDPPFPGALQTVGDLRRNHRGIVLNDNVRRASVEKRNEAPAARCLRSWLVSQHVERRHGHHLDVGRRFELLDIGEQLGLVWRSEESRSQNQFRRMLPDRGDRRTNRLHDQEVRLYVLAHQDGQRAPASGIGFDSKNAWHWWSPAFSVQVGPFTAPAQAFRKGGAAFQFC